FAENTDDLFVGKTLLHGDVLMWLMKTLLTSGCTNQRGAGQASSQIPGSIDNYVTGVREGSQQCCGVKDAGD
ncbi:hypothetical protein L0E61_22205, partial [Klebsiella pneumoniae]|nr:hypothetical protein [Klebsiella pneumoniae]MCF0852571.1 hypothetical protein [Klebsiella pneumoniae]MCF0896841.1 hypothetical protein [Klebsiella pneumoniae]MCF0913164.1 hypothetical protein [Klebsiella pneumoniae]